jgi:ABC-type uncharacterized transport system ATPase subunit
MPNACEVLGMLGPNAAGKTTTIQILEGFRMPSAGEVSVLGVDPARGDEAWLIGLSELANAKLQCLRKLIIDRVH